MDFGLSYEKIAFSGRKNMPSYGATHKIRVIKPYIDYLVQSGDTLQGIALKHDITMDELKRINKIWTNDSLFINRLIKIPKTSTENMNATDLNFINSKYSNCTNGKITSTNGCFDDINNQSSIQNNIHRINRVTSTPPPTPSPGTTYPPHPLSQDYAAYYATTSPALLGPELNRFSNAPPPAHPNGSSSNENLRVTTGPSHVTGPFSEGSFSRSGSRISVGPPIQGTCSPPAFASAKRSPRVTIRNGATHTGVGKNFCKNYFGGGGGTESLSRTNSSVSNDLDTYGGDQAEMIEL